MRFSWKVLALALLFLGLAAPVFASVPKIIIGESFDFAT